MTFPGSRAAFSRAELHFSSRLYFVTAVAPRWPIPQELADIDAGCGFTIGFFSLTLKPPITHTGPVPAWAPSGWHSLIPMEHPEPCGTAQQLLAHRSALVCSWWCSAASLPGHLHGISSWRLPACTPSLCTHKGQICIIKGDPNALLGRCR